MNDRLQHLEKSLDNLSPIFDALAEKYGEDGAERIMSTKALLYLIGTDRTKEEILKLADKVALFNGVNKKE